MEKSVKIIFFVMILVLSTSLVHAGTKVTIKTLQYHQVEVIVADGTVTDYLKIGDYEGDADEYGDFTFNVDTSKPLINLYVHVKRYSEEIASETFMGEKTGKPLNFTVAPGGYELIETPKIVPNKTNLVATNESTTNETLVVNESVIEDSAITGSSVSIGNFFKSKIFYYILGGVVLLVIIFFIIRYFRKRNDHDEEPRKEIKVRKLSEIQQERNDKAIDYKGIIDNAEKKIKEAQNELNKLRKEDQIKAMKRKIAEDENELRRLRRGAGYS